MPSLAHIHSARPSPRRVCLTGGALVMPATVRAAEGEVAAKCATVALTASRVRCLRPQQLPQSTHELPKGARYPFAHRRTRGPPYSTKASRRFADVRRSLPFSLRTAGARREECRVCPPIVFSSLTRACIDDHLRRRVSMRLITRSTVVRFRLCSWECEACAPSRKQTRSATDAAMYVFARLAMPAQHSFFHTCTGIGPPHTSAPGQMWAGPGARVPVRFRPVAAAAAGMATWPQ